MSTPHSADTLFTIENLQRLRAIVESGTPLATNTVLRLIDNARENLTAAQPEVNSEVESFINDRPGYVTALLNVTGDDSEADYWRWQGHAEARRQLAQALGWTIPHNPGETTHPEVTP